MNNNFNHSTLFKFLKYEKKEIERLKWIESEKVNYDIGFNKALLIWVTKHRCDWITQYKALST